MLNDGLKLAGSMLMGCAQLSAVVCCDLQVRGERRQWCPPDGPGQAAGQVADEQPSAAAKQGGEGGYVLNGHCLMWRKGTPRRKVDAGPCSLSAGGRLLSGEDCQVERQLQLWLGWSGWACCAVGQHMSPIVSTKLLTGVCAS